MLCYMNLHNTCRMGYPRRRVLLTMNALIIAKLPQSKHVTLHPNGNQQFPVHVRYYITSLCDVSDLSMQVCGVPTSDGGPEGQRTRL